MKTIQGEETQSSRREHGITIVNKEALHNWLLSGSRYPAFTFLAAQLRHLRQQRKVYVSLAPSIVNAQPEAAQP